MNNREHVLSTLRRLTASIKKGTKTPEEATGEFRNLVSKQQIEYCLLDKELDADDAQAVRAMAQFFYGSIPESN